MNKTLIWMIIEVALIVLGTGQFFSSLCTCFCNKPFTADYLGLGAAMMMLGYLISKKRQELAQAKQEE